MNVERAPEWLPSLLVPFFTLSYPTNPPTEPDSFPTSSYFSTGLLDGCLMVTCIAVMALLRDATRLVIMEPYARWHLTRKVAREHERKARHNGASNGAANCNGKSNGTGQANGNGHTLQLEDRSNSSRSARKEARLIQRSVLRFAEQGWSVIYYTIQWSYGLVCLLRIFLSNMV